MLQTKDLKLITPFETNENSLLYLFVVGFADNHAAHHVAGVEEIVEAGGALLLYFPLH